MTEGTGLTSTEAAQRLTQYGPNSIAERKASLLAKLLHWLIAPMSLLLLAAAALSFYLHKNFDGWFILALYAGNFGIAQWHESKADQAISTLQAKLAVQVQAKRDGQMVMVPSVDLVPGDVVQLGVGNVISADLKILEAKNLSINEAALTGESMPQDKKVGNDAFTGSFITTGSLLGQVTATGSLTKFGKTITLVDAKPKNSALEKDILMITKYLTAVALLAIVVMTSYLLVHHESWADLLTLDLSVLIAGVPVAMPTVMSLIMSLGVVRLTRQHVVVRRLSSLEDLANVNLLLSDKTGTLTKNQIVVEKILPYGQNSPEQFMQWAYSVTYDNKFDAINQAIIQKAHDLKVSAYKQLDFTPADSKRKRSSAQVEVGRKRYTVSLGAPQIVAEQCRLDSRSRQQLDKDVTEAANQGYRSLALARVGGQQESKMELMGLLLLSDVLRPDAQTVINFLKKSGVDVKLMTGDNRAIASRVAQTLGLQGNVVAAAGQTKNLSVETIAGSSVFAEVLPDDKFRIVKAASRHWVVAATGDGVNDLPALKQANVGIAVNSAVDAL
ncbi:MAG: HAD-IC family P-type ATPase, partial [Candidatus Saccharimonadales bacterium]